MDSVIEVEKEDIKHCFAFAEELYEKEAASSKEFGRKEMMRSKKDYIADHVLGKVAECAFRKFILKLDPGLKLDVDFSVWEDQHVHDEGSDINILTIDSEKYHFNYKTDVKATRSNSQWLLVEKQKFHDFQTQIYVICKIRNIPSGQGFEKNPYYYRNKKWDIEIAGYAFNKDIAASYEGPGWFEYPKGARLINPHILAPLRSQHRSINIKDFQQKTFQIIEDADQPFIGGSLHCQLNFALPINWMKSTQADWLRFIQLIRTKSTRQ